MFLTYCCTSFNNNNNKPHKVWRIPQQPSAASQARGAALSPNKEGEPPGRRRAGSVASGAAAMAGLLMDLPHAPPSFVFAARFHPTSMDHPVVVTGAHDHGLRLWDISPTARLAGKAGAMPGGLPRGGKVRQGRGQGNKGTGGGGGVDRLTGELGRGKAHHRAGVNAMTFDRKGKRLFTGDADGRINIWRVCGDPANPNMYVRAKGRRREGDMHYAICRVRVCGRDKDGCSRLSVTCVFSYHLCSLRPPTLSPLYTHTSFSASIHAPHFYSPISL